MIMNHYTEEEIDQMLANSQNGHDCSKSLRLVEDCTMELVEIHECSVCGSLTEVPY